jgi:hypothetical protein
MPGNCPPPLRFWKKQLWGIDPLLDKDLETYETIPVAMQRRGKYASSTIELLLETAFSTLPVQRGYKEENWGRGGVEYLHRGPASRRRRRKGKSRI